MTIRKNIFAICLTMFFLASCQKSVNYTASPQPAPPIVSSEQPLHEDPQNEPAKNCDFAVVDVPKNFFIQTENLVSNSSRAFRTTSCKTVVIGFLDGPEAGIFAARFSGDDLDLTYGNKGLKHILFNVTLSSQVFLEKVNNRVIYLSATNDLFGYFFFSFDLDGNLQKEAFNFGFAFEAVEPTHYRGTRCRVEPLRVKKVTVDGSKIVADGTVGGYCASSPLTPVSVLFDTEKPQLSDLQKDVPITCDHINYKTQMGYYKYTFTQSSCNSIGLRYSEGNYGSIENITIPTNGSCFKSDRFKWSCFYYENGHLVRESVNEYWQQHKSYFAMVKSESGVLCGRYIKNGNYVIESAFPQMDSRFLKFCKIY